MMGRRVWEGKREELFGLEILSAALIHWANRILVAFFLRYLLWASVTVFENLSFSSELVFLLVFFLSSFNACKRKTFKTKMSFSQSSVQ